MIKSLMVALVMMVGASTASAQYGVSQHAIYGGLGFMAGGLALGVDYENLSSGEFGIGGYARIYQKDEDNGAPGITALGGFIRPHFSKKAWDFYVSPGFAIISIDSDTNNRDDATTLGPSMAIGLMYEMSGAVALGVENMSHWVWFEEDWRGMLIDDFMLRFRMSF
jgi:hypothetical protein